MRAILFSVFVFWYCLSFAQNEPGTTMQQRADIIQDSLDQLQQDSINMAHKNSHLISFEAAYVSKVVYRGRDFGLKQYGFNTSLVYKTPVGIYVNLNNYKWSGINTPFAKTDLGIGIEKDLTPHLNLNVSYERWFLAKDSFFVGLSFKNMIQAALSTNYEKLNGELGVYYLWGKENALLIQAQIDYTIDLPGTGKNFYWNIKPALLVEGYAGDKSVGYGDTTRYIVNNIPYRDYKTKHVLQSPDIVNYEAMLGLNIEFKNFVITPLYHYNYPIALRYEDPLLSPYLIGGYSYFSLNILYNLYFAIQNNGNRK
ncbi:MAG: hypothetical protein H7296_04280 [Bacteroidia bacterium]|nr:hypothetical protein [Bacteroidia bacterium]